MFFVADVQTGFGPFIAVYLTSQKWTQVDIGLVLSVGGLVALLGQMPGGALVDAARSERLVAGLAIGGIGASALTYALWPIFPVVLARGRPACRRELRARPGIAAISLGLVGHAAIGERFGRNARFASIGNGLAAAAMGACGYFLSNQAVFFVTAALLDPDAGRAQPDPSGAKSIPSGHMAASRRTAEPRHRRRAEHLLRKRPLLIFAGCVLLFHLANAAMLPLMGSVADDALERMGDGADRGLHRRAAAHRRR